MAHLLLCRHCTRYFKHQEPACPFCTTAPLSREPPPALALPRGASRSRIHAARMAMLASAATFVACTDGSSMSDPASNVREQTSDADASDGSSNTAANGDDESNTDGATPDDGATGGDDTAQGETDDLAAADDTADDPADDTADDPADDTADDSADDTADDSADDTADEAVTDDSSTDDLTADDSNTSDDQVEDTTDTSDAGTVLGMGGAVCPGHLEQEAATCRSDADCTTGSVCSPQPVLVYPDRETFDPCRFMDLVCIPEGCDGECQPDPSGCGTVCMPICTESNCSGTAECVDNQCTLKACDAEGAQACFAGYVCAPTAANATTQGCSIIPCDEAESLGCAATQRCAPEEPNADGLGCVLLKCDEEGGPACQQFFGCNPDAPEANVLGCAQLSCADAGGSECPAGMACRPDDMGAQQTGIYQGCATILCNETNGPLCAEGYSCLPGTETAAGGLANGCAPASCLDGWSCDPWRACNPDAAAKDLHSCADQACTVDTDCGCGYCFNEVCVPDEPICRVPEIVATPYGCVWPDDEFV